MRNNYINTSGDKIGMALHAIKTRGGMALHGIRTRLGMALRGGVPVH